MENMDDFLDMFLSMTPSPEPEIMHGGKPEHAGHDLDDEDEIKMMLKKIMCMLAKLHLDDMPEPKEGDGIDVLYKEDGEPDIKGAFKSIKGVINGDSPEDKEPEKDSKKEKPEDEDKTEKKSPFCKARKGGF
jgi:hypothetical protein